MGRPGVLQTAFGGPHRLIRQSLQPQDPGQVGPRVHPRVDLKANELPSLGQSGIVEEHTLEMESRVWQITQIILRPTDHSLAYQAIVRTGSLRRQRIEPLSQAESDAM